MSKIMSDFIGFDNFDTVYTSFTANTIIQFIEEHLTDLCGKDNYIITKDTTSDATNKWNVELQINSWKQVKSNMKFYIIYTKNYNNESNKVKFITYYTIERDIWEEKIFTLIHFITRKEKLCTLRYLEREPMLLFLDGCINNYDNFSAEDLEQIIFEKIISKKRRVLENPWMQREIFEYLDYVRPMPNNKLFKK